MLRALSFVDKLNLVQSVNDRSIFLDKIYQHPRARPPFGSADQALTRAGRRSDHLDQSFSHRGIPRSVRAKNAPYLLGSSHFRPRTPRATRPLGSPRRYPGDDVPPTRYISSFKDQPAISEIKHLSPVGRTCGGVRPTLFLQLMGSLVQTGL